MKIDIDGLYDSFGSEEARRSFEEALLGRIREKLSWLHKRVSIWNEYRQFLDHIVEAANSVSDADSADENSMDLLGIEIPEPLKTSRRAQKQPRELNDAISKFDDSSAECAKFSEFNKAEWQDIVSILWIIVGQGQLPDDDNAFDIDNVEAIPASYRARHSESHTEEDSPKSTGVVEGSHKRDRPPDEQAMVEIRMRQGLVEGRYTLDELQHMKQEALAAMFGCSRKAAVVALKALLDQENAADLFAPN